MNKINLQIDPSEHHHLQHSPLNSHHSTLTTSMSPSNNASTSIVKFKHQPHPSIELRDLDTSSLAHLKRINSSVLPAKYSARFYIDSLNVGQLAKMAWFDGIPVGVIRCDIDDGSNRFNLRRPAEATATSTDSTTCSPPTTGTDNNTILLNNKPEHAEDMEDTESTENTKNTHNIDKIYIMTLAVLAPYRMYGIATLLVSHIAQQAKIRGIKEVYVHAWTENEDAIEWYENRGFVKQPEIVRGYYRRMRPEGDAYILSLMC